jgi:hypothetical protein
VHALQLLANQPEPAESDGSIAGNHRQVHRVDLPADRPELAESDGSIRDDPPATASRALAGATSMDAA